MSHFVEGKATFSDILFIYLFATEHFPSDVVPAAGTKALPLQQHAEQGRVHGCGGCPQCEIQFLKKKH